MAKFIKKNLATGNLKVYYQNDNAFEAVGTLYRDDEIYYTAAHPTLGLWVCGHNAENTPIPIGFINWNNIKRIAMNESGTVFIVVKNYQSVIDNADFTFRKMYKGAYTHQMNTGEMAICIPTELCSGSILPYLQQRYPMEQVNEVHSGSTFWNIVAIVAFGLIILGLIASFLG